MPRYLIEREFPEGLRLALDEKAAETCRRITERNLQDGVTWLHSYVAPDSTRMFCLYEGPTPEAIRAAAARSKLPITRITQVRVLNPYFYE